jgi:hypothetical protein
MSNKSWDMRLNQFPTLNSASQTLGKRKQPNNASANSGETNASANSGENNETYGRRMKEEQEIFEKHQKELQKQNEQKKQKIKNQKLENYITIKNMLETEIKMLQAQYNEEIQYNNNPTKLKKLKNELNQTKKSLENHIKSPLAANAVSANAASAVPSAANAGGSRKSRKNRKHKKRTRKCKGRK